MKPVWLSHYPAGVPAEVDVRRYASLVDLFEQSCRRFRDRPAFSSMGATLSYAETDRLSRDFAAYLQGLGLQAGDRVAIMLPNLLQYPVALFGVLRAGLVAVNVNPLYTARHYEAALVLRDIDAGEGGSRLKQTTPAPLRQAVTYTVEGRARQADLYLPATLETCAENCPRATLIAVPGAVPLASDDPRFTAFANSLARAGYAVLAPRMPGFRQLRVRPADAREIADAFAYAAGRPELAPGGRAGLFAFSYAVGPAVLTALEPGFLTQDLPDLWRLWRVMDLLLAEREAAP